MILKEINKCMKGLKLTKATRAAGTWLLLKFGVGEYPFIHIFNSNWEIRKRESDRAVMTSEDVYDPALLESILLGLKLFSIEFFFDEDSMAVFIEFDGGVIITAENMSDNDLDKVASFVINDKKSFILSSMTGFHDSTLVFNHISEASS